MTSTSTTRGGELGTFAPLSVPTFRTIWLASLVTNIGALIQAVGSAWIMAEIATPDMVAMVQAATFLPLALLAIPAGAFADMYDRRKTQMAAICVAMIGATALTGLSLAHAITPWGLLGMCFFIGCGMALFGPAWQSSPGEQVPPALLPQAVALNGISYNVARSFGPAIGGIIVATAGVSAAFAANVVCYVPILLALAMWRRPRIPTRLPPEQLARAMMSGMRYIVHMQPVRTAISRSLVIGVLGAALLSLMPLIARAMPGATARTFGIMLGCFGAGAVGAIFILQRLRRMGNERLVRICSMALGACVGLLAISQNLPLSAALLFVAGGVWMVQVSTVSIAVQLFVPRWVTGRVVASLNATIAGGIAIGAIFWGQLAQQHGTPFALLVAAGLLAMAPLLGRFLPLADRALAATSLEEPLEDPEVTLDVNGRSGPIVIEVDYLIPADSAREFYDRMRTIRRIRVRTGAFSWSLSRDLNDAEHWRERYNLPTWNDYLRQRNRCTEEEMVMQRSLHDLLIEGADIFVHRRLERPFGSVRWRTDSPDA